MKKMGKIINVTMVVWMALIGNVAYAGCQCESMDGPLGALKKYDAVFSGRVKEILPINRYDYLAEFEVGQSWKGAKDRTVRIKSTTFRTSCGFEFEKGEEYLVYAYQYQNTLFTTECSRTSPITTAKRDLNALGAPKHNLASIAP